MNGRFGGGYITGRYFSQWVNGESQKPQILRFAQDDSIWFNERELSCLKVVRRAIDTPYEQEYWFNKISELASASRKSRVGKLAAVHTSRNSTQRVGLLLMNGTMSDAHIPP